MLTVALAPRRVRLVGTVQPSKVQTSNAPLEGKRGAFYAAHGFLACTRIFFRCDPLQDDHIGGTRTDFALSRDGVRYSPLHGFFLGDLKPEQDSGSFSCDFSRGNATDDFIIHMRIMRKFRDA